MREWLHDYFPGVFIQNYCPEFVDKDDKVRKYEIDFADPGTLVGVEINGYRDHASWKGFARDHEKYLLALEHGWDLLGVTTKQVYNDMPRLIEWVRVKLGSRL